MYKELLFKLVSISSVNSTVGELEIAKFIYQYLLDIKKKYEADFEVFFQDINDDFRKNVIAVVKGRKEISNKAVVFLGHFDTVDVEDYGILKDFAFDPIKLKQEFRRIYPHLVQDNVEFGRGIFDMKGGIVVNLIVFEELIKNIDSWGGYAIFLFVCDEEGDSKGMLNAIKMLRKFKESDNLDFWFCLDTDYTVRKAVYVGSIGKVLIGLFVRGMETHVGQSLEGINSNYILNTILSKVDDSFDLIEKEGDEFTSPPVVMKMGSIREGYNVKTNLYSFAYINHLFFKKSLVDIMNDYKAIVEKSIKEIIDRRKEILKNFSLNFEVPDIKIYSLADFFNIYGKIEKFLECGSSDYRDCIFFSLRDWVDGLGINYPFVLIFFLPPFYPSVKTSESIKSKLIDYLGRIDEKIEIFDYFPYISDLSFLGRIEDVEFLKSNMLGWGRYFTLDVETINFVSMPCLDWGVLGFDAHKFTERLIVDYSLERLPKYILEFFMRVMD